MYKIFAVIGVVVVIAVALGAFISGKPNETPSQLPETTPPSQQTQQIDPKSQGGTADPDRRQ